MEDKDRENRASNCQMRGFGTGVLGTRYCHVLASWYRGGPVPTSPNPHPINNRAEKPLTGLLSLTEVIGPAPDCVSSRKENDRKNSGNSKIK